MNSTLKKELRRMKKVDSKYYYKKLHLEPIKEVEDSEHLRGEAYVKSVLEDMSYEEIYG
tara:strand:- start:96 stop:272 length:177 start_codon:yes stop_codon:yes gene_type:complete